MVNPDTPGLVLASGSRYRAALLQRLQLPFDSCAPNTDETPHAGETVAALTRRLARDKAAALRDRFPQAWILGSDQSAACGDRILGKPGTLEQAREQLRSLSGQTVDFLTAVVLARDGQVLEGLDVTTVRFRRLDGAEIDRYLAAEPALDCAGSFKCEGLGITLFEEIDSRDPTGLVGLPLILTSRLLREAGFRLP
jgi:septum formation protein